ncbi:hypothetical protein Sste5346_009152 [Sporothrix stenoceras]|uniref:DUF6923 domain-containing protein n=1 Tax=Sporothrix stenoceras TaxID=5173 RepID=A0ABR3YMM2_9PEZI
MPFVGAMVASTALAGDNLCTPLAEAPYVTEALVILVELSTTITTTGVVTLGVDFPAASGLYCVAKTTTVTAAPTVCAVTALSTALTSSRCSVATTFTSCGEGDVCGTCSFPETYCWTPKPPPAATSTRIPSVSGTCPVLVETVTETATETITDAGATVKETVTDAGGDMVTETVTETVADVGETVTETMTTTDTMTVTDTVGRATVTLPPVTDVVTSYVTVAASRSYGYNHTISVVSQPANVTKTETLTVTEVSSTESVAYSTATVTITAVSSTASVAYSTATVTITEAPSLSSAAACSTVTASGGVSLSCDKYGYLIQSQALIQIDLASGDYTTITEDVGSSGLVNALGYNVLDNYLYGRDAGNNYIVRIGADGTSEKVTALTENVAGVVGDIDNEGNYWYATGEVTSWYQHDLLPGSPTYGAILNSGTLAATGRRIYDWVYIPVTGRYLWTIGTNSPSGGADLMQWSLETHTWTVVQNYPDITTDTFGALYGMNNGTIYASDNASGYIWAFDTSTTLAPYIASYGPVSSSNDGARCVLNLSV